MEARVDGEFDGEPQSLEEAVLGGIQPGPNPHAGRFAVHGRLGNGAAPSKALFQNTGTGLAFAVALGEALLDDDPLGIEQERPGIGNAFMMRLHRHAVGAMLCGEVLIEQAEAANDGTAGIRQQGIGNAVLLGEFVENIDRVIADRDDGDALTVEVLQAALQLNELRPAKRSPGGTAVKHDQGPPPSTPRMQVDWVAKLVGQLYIGERFADGGTDVMKVQLG